MPPLRNAGAGRVDRGTEVGPMPAITITCDRCGADFTWTAKEQRFYVRRGFVSPKRCPPCRRPPNPVRTCEVCRVMFRLEDGAPPEHLSRCLRHRGEGSTSPPGPSSTETSDRS